MTLLPYAALGFTFALAGGFIGWVMTRRRWGGAIVGALLGLGVFGLMVVGRRIVFAS